MGSNAIEIRVRHAEDLRGWWLDGFQDGGIFIPGAVSLPAGTPVSVRIVTELPVAGSTVLSGTIIWRRLPQRGGAAAPNGVTPLRAGAGIAFDASMRSRLLFLDRLERGAAHEGRSAIRYPASLGGELVVLDGDRALPVRVEDVGVRGARVHLTEGSFLAPSVPVRLWLAAGESGASSFAPLAGHVAWLNRGESERLGVKLELGNKEDRLHWARVVNRCREDFERRFIAIERMVG